MPMGYLLDTPSGTMKNIIVERADSIETTLAHIVPEVTANLLGPIGIIIFLFALNWRMALVSLITLPLGLLCYMGMMKDYGAKFRRYVMANKRLNNTAVEYIGGIEVIKAFNQSAGAYKKFTDAARDAAASAIDWMRGTQSYFATAMAVFPAVLLPVLPLGGVLFMHGLVSASDLILCIILSLGVMTPLITVMSYSDDIGKIHTIVSEIAGVLGQEEMNRPAWPVKLSGYGIELENVRFGYHEKEVLHGVNLVIRPGSVTALVGPSGGGKSTIAKLIASLWEVGGGQIKIGGVDARKIPLDQINGLIAYVAQDNYLFNDTVRENIRMGNLKATDAQVEAVARASGCHDFILNLEKGYDTVVGGAGGHLSGGERQRVAIARAMLKDAPIVILDEATAYTDPENEAVIQAAVGKLVQGRTLIVIAHRLSTVMNSDNIVVVKDGAIEAQGTHGQLLEACPLYRDMWQAHVEARDEGEVA
jgi:ATP-binding cassette subfamily B protein